MDTNDARTQADLATFQSLRGELTGLAYRMLGDIGRAQDIVQEAWLRWHHRSVEAESPKAFLLTIVTRLALNELDSARARREESRGDRLPEPVILEEVGLDRLEAAEQVSMAFLVVLERLSAAERAVFLLHDVFDFPHEQIAPLIERNPAGCRKLLQRAREKVAAARRFTVAPREEHQRLLDALLSAVWSGEVDRVVDLLAEEAVIITDGGAAGRVVNGVRNLRRPLVGASHVASFILAASRLTDLQARRRDLNGAPAVVFYRDGAPFAALLLAVADGKVQQVFFHGDVTRLGHCGGSLDG